MLYAASPARCHHPLIELCVQAAPRQIAAQARVIKQMSKFVSRGYAKDLHQQAIRSEVKRHATALQRRMDRAKLRSPATQLGELRKCTPVVLESGVHLIWIPAKCLHGHECHFSVAMLHFHTCACPSSSRSTVTALA